MCPDKSILVTSCFPTNGTPRIPELSYHPVVMRAEAVICPLYGMPYKIEEILDVAVKYGILVIEDAAEGADHVIKDEFSARLDITVYMV